MAIKNNPLYRSNYYEDVSKQSLVKVLESKFMQSIENISQAPGILHTEIAILGRSNVGKSTLINLLLNNKNLAKSSSTPGKTRLINFFNTIWKKEDIRYEFHIIDFPGFGYAKVSKDLKRRWDKNLSIFLVNRSSIKLFMHLIDSRHTNLPVDDDIRGFLNNVKRNDCDIIEVYTKGDKLKNYEMLSLQKQGKSIVSKDDKYGINALRNEVLFTLYRV